MNRKEIEEKFNKDDNENGVFLCYLEIGFKKLWNNKKYNKENLAVVSGYLDDSKFTDKNFHELTYLLRALTLNIYLDDNGVK